MDLVLKPTCYYCQSTTELYGSQCKHMTVCFTCGRNLAKKKAGCKDCGAPVTRLIREYNVRACSSSDDKTYFISKFAAGLPKFSGKKNKWFRKTDSKLRNKGLELEDETGCRYHGALLGSQASTYYLLMKLGKEFVAMPVDSWYNFNNVVRCTKQFTLEEAEEIMKKRRSAASRVQQCMMKYVAAAEDVDASNSSKDAGDEESLGRYNDANDDDDDIRMGDDDGDDVRMGDDDDDDIRKGDDDDWEHEETFSDDDEAAAIHPEDHEQLPAMPGSKDEGEDDEEDDEEGLSKSGKEMKKLLRHVDFLRGFDVDDLITKEAAIEEPAENTASLKRKASEDTEAIDSTSLKKAKSESVNVVAAAPMCSMIREDEVRAYVVQKGQVTSRELHENFRGRLRTKEEKTAFFDMMKSSFMMKMINGVKCIVVKSLD